MACHSDASGMSPESRPDSQWAMRAHVPRTDIDEEHLSQLRRPLAHATLLPSETTDPDVAAALYRTCRQQGQAVCRLIDCLIGAVALRAGVAVLDRDADFEVVARFTAVRMA